MHKWYVLFKQITVVDIVDLILVTYIIYKVFFLLRKTKAFNVLWGIAILGAFYYIARIANLWTLEFLLRYFFSVLPLGIIVIFQSEIRDALAMFAQPSLRYSLTKKSFLDESIDEIVKASFFLAKKSTGALIVLERNDSLRQYIETGIKVEANVSFYLLVAIFNPKSPLHDGAVIIRGDRIVSASSFLPLSQSSSLPTELGTRHRAAIGITEETDAVVVVVSEERETVSLAVRGALEENLDIHSLRNHLLNLLTIDKKDDKR